MPSRAVAVLGSLAIATAAGGAGLTVAHAATTTSTTTKTLHYSANLGQTEKVAKGRYVILGTLTSRKLATSGKPVGYLTYTCIPTAKKGFYTCDAAFTIAGGVVLSRLTWNFANPSNHATVTSGDGMYAGVRGSETQQIEGTGVTVIDLTVTTK